MTSVRYDGSLTHFLAHYDVFAGERKPLQTSTEQQMWVFGGYDFDWGFDGCYQSL